MSALSLDFGPTERAANEYRRMVRAVDDAVAALGLEIAAGACGVPKADLRGMLDGRNGRRMSAEVAAVIAERVGPGSYRDAILDAVRSMFGLHAPEKDGEYIHRLEGALLKFGEPGGEVLARCRREARRG